jgi:hypothetical protein
MLGAEIIRAPGRVDIRFGNVNVFVAPVRDGDPVGPPPATISPSRAMATVSS